MAVIDAARPTHQTLKPTFVEIVGNRGGGYHHPRAGIVEAAQQRIGDCFRYPGAGGNIFRKPCVVARGERALRPQAIAARGKAHRAFGRDVDMIDRGSLQPSRYRPAACQRKPDFGVGRQRNRSETLRRQKLDFGAEFAQRAGHGFERANHAIDLRLPSIRRDQDSHHAAALAAVWVSSLAASAARRCSSAVICQRKISSLPSSCSATTVQDSTKSPVLT